MGVVLGWMVPVNEPPPGVDDPGLPYTSNSGADRVPLPLAIMASESLELTWMLAPVTVTVPPPPAFSAPFSDGARTMIASLICARRPRATARAPTLIASLDQTFEKSRFWLAVMITS